MSLLKDDGLNMDSGHRPPRGADAPVERLAPRMIKGLHADYQAAIWTGSNTSGLRVFGKNILVRMDSCAARSAGGVHLTDEIIDRMDEASESGCIYAIGPAAHRIFDDGSRWEGDKPQVGERVYVEKYAGVKARGADGALYRVMDERCIAAALAAPTGDE